MKLNNKTVNRAYIIKQKSKLFEELLFETIEKKYAIKTGEIIKIKNKLLENKNINRNYIESIPVKILQFKKISSLEAITKFLRDNKKLPYNTISQLLNRQPKSLASTYNIACKKMPESFSTDIDEDKSRIPFTAFSKNLSILEAICNYLHTQNHTYADISRMLNLDPRTVWTVCNRANKKLKLKDKAKPANE